MSGRALLFYFCLFVLLVGLVCLHFASPLSKWCLLPPIVAMGYVISFIWLTISSLSYSFGMIDDHACEAIYDIKNMMCTSLSASYIQRVYNNSLTSVANR